MTTRLTDPANQVPDGGILYDATITSTVAIATKSVVSRLFSMGCVFLISSSQNGNFRIMYVAADGTRFEYQGSTAYTGGTFIKVNIQHYVREAYVEFTPSAGSGTLYVEGWSYGR